MQMMHHLIKYVWHAFSYISRTLNKVRFRILVSFWFSQSGFWLSFYFFGCSWKNTTLWNLQTQI